MSAKARCTITWPGLSGALIWPVWTRAPPARARAMMASSSSSTPQNMPRALRRAVAASFAEKKRWYMFASPSKSRKEGNRTEMMSPAE